VVFYIDDLCDLLPFVYHKNNRRRYFSDEQKSVETLAILDEGKRTGNRKSKVGQNTASVTEQENKTDVSLFTSVLFLPIFLES
jgi:hypothetical protein